MGLSHAVFSEFWISFYNGFSFLSRLGAECVHFPTQRRQVATSHCLANVLASCIYPRVILPHGRPLFSRALYVAGSFFFTLDSLSCLMGKVESPLYESPEIVKKKNNRKKKVDTFAGRNTTCRVMIKVAICDYI